MALTKVTLNFSTTPVVLQIDGGTDITVDTNEYVTYLQAGEHSLSITTATGRVLTKTIQVPVSIEDAVTALVEQALEASQGYIDIVSINENVNLTIPYDITLRVLEHGSTGNAATPTTLKAYDNLGNERVTEALTYTGGYSQNITLGFSDMSKVKLFYGNNKLADELDIAYTIPITTQTSCVIATWRESTYNVETFTDGTMIGYATLLDSQLGTRIPTTATISNTSIPLDVTITDHPSEPQYNVEVALGSGASAQLQAGVQEGFTLTIYDQDNEIIDILYGAFTPRCPTLDGMMYDLTTVDHTTFVTGVSNCTVNTTHFVLSSPTNNSESLQANISFADLCTALGITYDSNKIYILVLAATGNTVVGDDITIIDGTTSAGYAKLPLRSDDFSSTAMYNYTGAAAVFYVGVVANAQYEGGTVRCTRLLVS